MNGANSYTDRTCQPHHASNEPWASICIQWGVRTAISSVRPSVRFRCLTYRATVHASTPAAATAKDQSKPGVPPDQWIQQVGGQDQGEPRR